MRMLIRALALAAILLPALAAGDDTAPLPHHIWHAAQLVRMVDADTYDLATTGQVVRVRLADADTPERDQPFGENATKRAAALLASGKVEIMPVAADRYGRTVARVRIDGCDLAWTLVREGLAWPDCHQCGVDDRLYFGVYGSLARWAGTGMWAADPVKPATWRRQGAAK